MSRTTQFVDRGFMVLDTPFDTDGLLGLQTAYDELLTRAQDILAEVTKKGISFDAFYRANQDLIVVPEASDPSEICRFEYIAATSSYMQDVVVANLRDVINELMQDSFVLFKDKCNVKNPGGGAFPPHQDISAYYHFGPKYFVTAAVLLDDATIENGCLEMAKGYQDTKEGIEEWVETQFGKLPMFAFYRGGKNNGDIHEEVSCDFEWEQVEAKRGDVILFDAYVPHRSMKNDSELSRRMFFFTFNLASEGDLYRSYYETKMNNFSDPMFHVATPTQHDAV